MSKVFQKLGLFGKTYWLDNGLTVKRISKQKYEDMVIDYKVAKEVYEQQKKGKK
jgi:hypothetical protein